MTSKVFRDGNTRESLQFTAMFDALSPAYRASVALQALRARDHVATESGRALDSAIRGSIRLVGYSNPALAISSVLLEPVANSVAKSEKLAAAALRVWAESHEDLHRLVMEHLEMQGIPAQYPDFSAGGFRDFWDEDSWQRELDWIVEFTEDWSEEDIALMLCYVSGKTIIVPDFDDDESEEVSAPVTSLRDRTSLPPEPAVEATPSPRNETPHEEVAPPEPPAGFVSPDILTQCIAYLRSLKPEDWNWNQAVPDFVETVGSIRELKAAQRERRASLAVAHGEIEHEFAPDLEFLEQDISAWSPEGLTDLVELDRTLELAAGLKRLLTEYRDVRRPGATLSEELTRRERRFALEPRILDTMGLMRQAMFRDRNPVDGPASRNEAEPESAEPSGLRPSLSREPPLQRPGYQGELIYEPSEEGKATGKLVEG